MYKVNYLKAKIKSDDEVSNRICLSVILIDSFLRWTKSIISKCFQKNANILPKKKKWAVIKTKYLDVFFEGIKFICLIFEFEKVLQIQNLFRDKEHFYVEWFSQSKRLLKPGRLFHRGKLSYVGRPFHPRRLFYTGKLFHT